MARVTIFLAMFALVVISADADDTASDSFTLFKNLYYSVVRGSRILHDVTRGAGAVSEAIKAIDNILDANAVDELGQSIQQGGAQEPAPVGSLETEPATPAETQANPGVVSGEATLVDPDTPNFDGCGSLGFHIRDSNLPMSQMTDCCRVHSVCYSSSCKAKKRRCDGKLKKCLYSLCKEKKLLKSLKKSCKAAAKLLFSGSMALSFQQFKDAHKKLNCTGRHDRYRGRR